MPAGAQPVRKRPRRAAAAAPAAPPVEEVPADAAAAYGLAAALPGGATARCACGRRVRAADVAWALRGVEGALRASYRGTGLAWDRAEKRREMRSPRQRFVFADAAAGAGAVAFVSYRVDGYDGGAPGGRAAYVYEVYVAEGARRVGMARALLGLVEEICGRAGVPRVVLTVFDSNTAALRLYRDRLGYVADASCPSLHGNTAAKYQILTKVVGRRAGGSSAGRAAAGRADARQ
jgi:ribosomal protein S18 acetylase RimI-like enzyme